jgi:hypothetical protein
MSSRTANSSGLVETLQASMDVEDAIKQSAEMSTALARDSSAVHAVPKAELQVQRHPQVSSLYSTLCFSGLLGSDVLWSTSPTLHISHT